jgi:hypothetical protein
LRPEFGTRSAGLLPRQPSPAASALIRCTTLLPVPNSRATFKMPLPLASAALIAGSLAGSILALPIGLPLLVPCARALGMLPPRPPQSCQKPSKRLASILV